MTPAPVPAPPPVGLELEVVKLNETVAAQATRLAMHANTIRQLREAVAYYRHLLGMVNRTEKGEK